MIQVIDKIHVFILISDMQNLLKSKLNFSHFIVTIFSLINFIYLFLSERVIEFKKLNPNVEPALNDLDVESLLSFPFVFKKEILSDFS